MYDRESLTYCKALTQLRCRCFYTLKQEHVPILEENTVVESSRSLHPFPVHDKMRQTRHAPPLTYLVAGPDLLRVERREVWYVFFYLFDLRKVQRS